jgi:hypothetical protein
MLANVIFITSVVILICDNICDLKKTQSIPIEHTKYNTLHYNKNRRRLGVQVYMVYTILVASEPFTLPEQLS